MLPQDSDYDWTRWRWQTIAGHLPPCPAGDPAPMEVEDGQEQATTRQDDDRRNPLSAQYQDEYYHNKERAAALKAEEDALLHEAMASGRSHHHCPNPTVDPQRLRVRVTHATLEGGQERSEGVAVKAGEPFSLTTHLSVGSDLANETQEEADR